MYKQKNNPFLNNVTTLQDSPLDHSCFKMIEASPVKQRTKEERKQERKQARAERKEFRVERAAERRSKKGKEPRRTTKGKGRNFRTVEEGAGMTEAGVAEYRRKNPGSKLQTAVTGDVEPGSRAAKRRKSFCARSKGWTGERGKAARRRWKC